MTKIPKNLVKLDEETVRKLNELTYRCHACGWMGALSDAGRVPAGPDAQKGHTRIVCPDCHEKLYVAYPEGDA